VVCLVIGKGKIGGGKRLFEMPCGTF